MQSWHSPNQHASGFTLLEVVIVVGIVGLIAGSFLSFYQPRRDSEASVLTQQRIDRILDAASSYVIEHNELPLPAFEITGAHAGEIDGSPNPKPTGRPFGGAATTYHGIVPYKALGLSQEDAKDGFGNYLTFVVHQLGIQPFRSPVKLTNQAGLADEFNDCYTRTGNGVPPANAAGCAPLDTYQVPTGLGGTIAAGTKMRGYVPVRAVDDNRSNFCYDQAWARGTPANPGLYYRDIWSAASLPPTPTAITINRNGALETNRAFIVVMSHGRDGAGGYRFNASNALEEVSSGYMGTVEETNRVGTTNGGANPRLLDTISIANFNPTDKGTAHFDDQIGYLTGPALVSRTGSTSCHNYYPVCNCRKVCGSISLSTADNAAVSRTYRGYLYAHPSQPTEPDIPHKVTVPDTYPPGDSPYDSPAAGPSEGRDAYYYDAKIWALAQLCPTNAQNDFRECACCARDSTPQTACPYRVGGP